MDEEVGCCALNFNQIDLINPLLVYFITYTDSVLYWIPVLNVEDNLNLLPWSETLERNKTTTFQLVSLAEYRNRKN